MTRLTVRPLAAALLSATLAGAVLASEPGCTTAPDVEEFRYTWRLRGALSWIGGLVVPTAGSGSLRTTYPSRGEHAVRSELVIVGEGGKDDGYVTYESRIDDRGPKTLVTEDGWVFGAKSRIARASFDYEKGHVLIRKETPNELEYRAALLPKGAAEARDLLTVIYFLRLSARELEAPLATSVFTDGQEYQVIITPGEKEAFEFEGKLIPARLYELAGAPGGRPWKGDIRLLLSDDERRMPLRIRLWRGMTSLQMDLQSVEACAFLAVWDGEGVSGGAEQ